MYRLLAAHHEVRERRNQREREAACQHLVQRDAEAVRVAARNRVIDSFARSAPVRRRDDWTLPPLSSERLALLDESWGRVDWAHEGQRRRGHASLRFSAWLVHPGSPTDKRSWLRYSYAILDIERSRVRPRLVFHVDRLT
jgi:hypothetical protein